MDYVDIRLQELLDLRDCEFVSEYRLKSISNISSDRVTRVETRSDFISSNICFVLTLSFCAFDVQELDYRLLAVGWDLSGLEMPIDQSHLFRPR